MPDYADLRQAGYHYLLADAGIQALVASGALGKDVPGGPWEQGWVFQGLEEIKPFRDVEGTGKSAIVLRVMDSWGQNKHNSASFPTLQVLVWADPTRNADGSTTARDATAKCEVVCRAVDRLLHDPANSRHIWPLGPSMGNLFVVACVRSAGPSIEEVPDSDGGCRGELRYEVSM